MAEEGECIFTKKYNKLSALLSKKVIDWEKAETIIKSLGDHINDNYVECPHDDDNDTLLSKLYFESHSYKRGEMLLKLTKLFLQYGYDVHANNDLNGSICLHKLCWASYDKYILHIAELLLDAGANTHIKIEDDFEDGILNSISWKLGAWNIGCYNTANMFEAYYQMIKAEQAGENYRGIRDVSDCLDLIVTKVECSGVPSVSKNRTTFGDFIVIWFGKIPLILDKKIELISNPNRACKGNYYVDMSFEFSEIIGKKFIKYKFSDAGCVSMFFENDIKLVLSNNWPCDEKDITGYLDIKSKFAPNKIK